MLRTFRSFKKLIIAIALVVAAFPAQAQTGTSKPTATLNAEVNQLWPDQNAGALTPFGARQTLLDIIASSGSGLPAAATANQIPVYPGSNGAPVPTSATTWFDNAYCNTVGQIIARVAGAWTCNQQIPIPVTWFSGVVCNGSNDDTSGIQTIINGLPNDGGELLIQTSQNCKLTSTLTIGNGTASTVSTKRGVIIRGAGIPNTPTGLQFFNGYTTTAGPKLTWAGGAAPMIQINGPLQGWGLKNLLLDCASVANSTGINVVSGQFGDNSNLTVQNCPVDGIVSTSQPIGGFTGVGNVDSIRNNWVNTFVLVPATTNARGIRLTGDSGGTSNTDYNTFTNTFIRFAGSPGSPSNVGLYLAVTDSNVFTGLNISGGTTTNTANIVFDYSVNSTFPLGNVIFGLDSNGSVNQFLNTGAPGGGAKVNQIYGIQESNGGTVPNLANLSTFFGGAWPSYTSNPTCGSATFSGTISKFSTMGKNVTAQIDTSINVLGTCTNTLTWTLPATSNSSAGFAGQLSNLAAGFTCQFGSAATTVALCRKTDGTNFGAGDHLIASYSYEKQ